MLELPISPTGVKILKLLVGRPPKSVAELIEAADVTRTAVTEQLIALMSAGFIERAVERASVRGRPRHLYRATDAALLLLAPGNQQVMVPAIWRAIFDIGDDKLIKRIVKRVGDAIAEHYHPKVTAKKPADRLRQLVAAFVAEGGLYDLAETGNGQWTVNKRSCPFIGMGDDHKTVCRIDQQIMNSVVGKPLRRTACRHDGDPCCSFELGAK